MIQPHLRSLSEDVARLTQQLRHRLFDGHAFKRHAQHTGEHHRHQRLALCAPHAAHFANHLDAVHIAVRHVLPEPLLGSVHPRV